MDKSGLVAGQWLQEVMAWAAVEHFDGRLVVGPTAPTTVIFRRGLIAHVERDDTPTLPDSKAEANEVYSAVLADLVALTDGEYALHQDRDVSTASPWLFGPLALLAAAEDRSWSDDDGLDDDGPDEQRTIWLRDAAGDDEIVLSPSAWRIVVAMALPRQDRSLEALLGWSDRRLETTLSELEAQGLLEAAPKRATRPPDRRPASTPAFVDLASVERSQDDSGDALPDAATIGDDDQNGPVRVSALRRLIRSLE